MPLSTEACGTPLLKSRQLDDLSFMTTRCLLSESQSSSHLRIFPTMPCDFFNNRLWGALSNVFESQDKSNSPFLSFQKC